MTACAPDGEERLPLCKLAHTASLESIIQQFTAISIKLVLTALQFILVLFQQNVCIILFMQELHTNQYWYGCHQQVIKITIMSDPLFRAIIMGTLGSLAQSRPPN